MFGKVHHAFNAGAQTVKAGLGRLNHHISNAYAMGHKAHGLYNTSKQIASLFMPAISKGFHLNWQRVSLVVLGKWMLYVTEQLKHMGMF